jgi:lysophospholipase L1-like esterase
MRRSVLVLLIVLAQAGLPSAAPGAGKIVPVGQASLTAGTTGTNEHWVPTWGTAQQLIRITPATPLPAPAAAAAQPAPAPPATSTPPPFRVTTLNNQTVRMILRTSISGRRVRVKLSHAFGMPASVIVGSAHVARRGTEAGIVAGSDRALTFGGKSSFTLMPGVVVVSDPVDLDVPALSDLAVSLFFPRETGALTTHATGLRPTYVSTEGDFSGASEFPLSGTTQQYYWLSSVEVVAPESAAAVVAFGDSITDGARSTPDTNHSWPALLAARLAANKATANIGVVNEGIGGNRLLTDANGLAGVSALARFDRDVLSHPSVKWLMILEGINDIGSLANPAANFPVTSDDLIWVLKEMVARAHAQGIKVVGCTLTPYGGAGYARDEGEAMRATVNEWIRKSGTFDAVVDFEAATRDSADPKKFKAEFDPGDHLHPNNAGYEAMANAVDLSIFGAKSGKTGTKTKK